MAVSGDICVCQHWQDRGTEWIEASDAAKYQQKIIQRQMSIVPRLRNPELKQYCISSPENRTYINKREYLKHREECNK